MRLGGRHRAAARVGARGFSWDGSGTPHVLGDDGRILAVLFGAPLSSPPEEDRANKVLWVVHESGPGPLVISAYQEEGSVVQREVRAGRGSTLDLPGAGCWRLELSWGGGQFRDTVALDYVAPPL